MPDITKHQFRVNYIARAVKSRLAPQHIPSGEARWCYGFAYIIAGTCIYTFDNGTVITASDGDLMCLAKGQDYSMDIISPQYDYYACDFDLLTNLQMQSIRIHPKNTLTMEHLFARLVNAYTATSAYNRLECMSLLYQLYIMVIQNTQTQYVPGSSRARIETARTWIHNNLSDPELQVSQLAQQANMSEVHFRKLFQALYATTPAKYIVQKRIDYAKKLMELSELQLEDIALQSGFTSHPYFCKVFKSITGTTPSTYRQNILHQE